MKNAYLTSHFPLISIILFSLSFAIFSERILIQYLQDIGLYTGMIEFFSEGGIHLTLLFVLWLFFFMLFAALKLIADTVNEISLLFFSRDEEGADLKNVRNGTWIFLFGGVAAVVSSFEIWYLLIVFVGVCFLYFIYFIYKVSESLSTSALFGLIFFHLFFWSSFLLLVIFALVKLYNSFIASLPI